MQFQEAISNPFPYFCTWLLSKDDFGVGSDLRIDETWLPQWFKFYYNIFDNKDKIVKVNKSSSNGYSTFMAFYLYYLALNKPGSKIIVIEEPYKITNKLPTIEIILKEVIKSFEGLESITHSSKKKFINGTEIKSLRPSTYSIRNINEIDLIVFDNAEIKNTEKLYYDIEETMVSDKVHKMILTIKNNISEFFPEIKTIELK